MASEDNKVQTAAVTSAMPNAQPLPTSTESAAVKETSAVADVTPSTSNGEQSSTTNPQQPKPPSKKPKKPPVQLLTGQKKIGKRSYVQMVHEAIVALNDRTGSSQIAIQKYLLATYPELKDGRPFRTRMSMTLKTGVNNKRFAKVKASYKIHVEWNKKHRKKSATNNSNNNKNTNNNGSSNGNSNNGGNNSSAIELAMQKKVLEEEKKLQELAKTLSQEEIQKLREQSERELEKQRKKEEAALKAKEREERIKKRKLPMEDTKLHAEDKELGIKPPEDVQKRPNLPHLFQLVRPDSKNLAPSRCEQFDFGSRGLVPDLLQVYHFFQGDVHFGAEEPARIVPNFGLRHLIYAVDELLLGNARRSRLVPPLIVHLFVTSLRLLTRLPEVTETPAEKRLRQDLVKLGAGLSPVSWGEICVMYMDAMERYYTTDATRSDVLPPGRTDIRYLMRVTDTPIQEMDIKMGDLPEGYCGYLGDSRSSLARAHAKLYKQEPWTLSAEELMALLRTLTDDVLAMRPEIVADISARESEMSKLLKAKKAADYTFRKTRCAYEGPKKMKKSDKLEGIEEDGDKKNDENDTPNQPKWRRTATKKQFEAAKKAQQKANDAYEKGLRRLMSRTEPVGQDRNFNNVYFFRHDPECLYVETVRSATGLADYLPQNIQLKRTGWQVINTKTCFDGFTASLDIRGTREHDLYEAMLGPVGSHQSLGRLLFDDAKEKNAIEGRKRRREELKTKMSNAQIAVLQEEDGGGRRSGRLHHTAQDDLEALEKEAADLEKKIEADEAPKIPDYEELTGLAMLRKFDAQRRRRTRRSDSTDGFEVDDPLLCSKLCVSGNDTEEGAVGLIVSQILDCEDRCEDLASCRRPNFDRDQWISDLEKLVRGWNGASNMLLGPESERQSLNSPDAKRSRIETPPSTPSSQLSSANVLNALKKPLLELEQRVFDVSGLAMANRDADIADDNMSTASDDGEMGSEEQKSDEETRKREAWKKVLHTLKDVPAKRCGRVRELVADAITAARKAQLGKVVSDLRSAILQYQTDAAGDCRREALAVLEKYGGYEDDDDDSEGEENKPDEEQEPAEEKLPSNLCGEAMMITGSLLGDDGANRVDWRDAVSTCRTISRMAALCCAFTKSATKTLTKLQNERDALNRILELWSKEEERRSRSRSSGTKHKTHSATTKALNKRSEVWADVHYTNEFCMVKLDSFPWWPAKKCVAKDMELVESLRELKRELVSIVGEDGSLRLVKPEDIKDFTGSVDEADLVGVKKGVRSQLGDCVAMARRIMRGHAKVKESDEFSDEKKSAS